MKPIDQAKWKRREYFDFFSMYDNPFFGMVSEVECTNGFLSCKQTGRSFFGKYLHSAIKVANSMDCFRQRIVDEVPVMYDVIHAASTIGRKDGSFAFSLIEFQPNSEVFLTKLKEVIQKVNQTTGLNLNEEAHRHDVIQFSSLPWRRFTGLTHASRFGQEDSVPKISFGKVFKRGEKHFLPISVDVHHGFMDGWHIAQYLTKLEEELRRC